MSNQSQPSGEFLLYTTDDGKTRVECRFAEETIWLSQALMAELYDRSKTISEHLQNLFEEGELELESVVRNFRTTAEDGKTYEVQYYNLEAVLAVGFRVRNHRGTEFRQWAIKRLNEYLVKGFTIDDLLKNMGGGLYWKELLERIREIWALFRRAPRLAPTGHNAIAQGNALGILGILFSSPIGA